MAELFVIVFVSLLLYAGWKACQRDDWCEPDDIGSGGRL